MKLEIMAGENIAQAARMACELAKEKHLEINFEFNGIDIYVSPQSFSNDIIRIYHYLCEIRRLKSKI